MMEEKSYMAIWGYEGFMQEIIEGKRDKYYQDIYNNSRKNSSDVFRSDNDLHIFNADKEGFECACSCLNQPSGTSGLSSYIVSLKVNRYKAEDMIAEGKFHEIVCKYYTETEYTEMWHKILFSRLRKK